MMDTFRNHLHLPVTKIDDSARMLARLKVQPGHLLIPKRLFLYAACQAPPQQRAAVSIAGKPMMPCWRAQLPASRFSH